MNIDYEAIAVQAGQSTNSLPLGVKQTKAIIEAYEAQKKAPEWVPLDLEKVKQGWEVRQARWQEDTDPHRFVATYEGDMVVEVNGGVHRRVVNGFSWLMRAPKPKTVRVEVLMEHIRKELRVQLASESPPVGYWQVVGEGDIEVRE